MKKIKFISALALTMVLASCENYDLPNPPGQTNPEPDGIFANSGLVIEQGATDVDLVNANSQNVNVNVANITALENFPENYDLVINMEVSGDENFSKVAVAKTTIVDKAVMVNPDVFNNAIKEAITKTPGTLDVYARFVALAQRGSTTLRLGGLNAYFADKSKFKVATLNPAKWMENSFYVVPVVNGTADFAKAVKMDNTLGNVSVYDNPEFAAKVDVTEAGLEWKLAPVSVYQSKDASKLLGCIPSIDSDLAGKLAAGSDAGKISLVGSVLITVNVELDSYTINYAFECLYPFSGSVKPENMMKLYTTDYINYRGVTAINRQWTLAAQPDKTGPVVFKMVDGSAVTDETGLYQTGLLTSSSDGKNITAPVKGNTLYWTEVNLVQLTYSVKAMTTLSVIGAGNNWDLATATPLTPSKDLRTWTAENVEIGSEFKINANGAWDLDFGGKEVSEGVYTLDFKGSNMVCAKPGTYKVTIDFSKLPYTLTLEK